jgi:hypothetical protein
MNIHKKTSECFHGGFSLKIHYLFGVQCKTLESGNCKSFAVIV